MTTNSVAPRPRRGWLSDTLRDVGLLFGSIVLIVLVLVALNRVPVIGVVFTERLSWIWGLGAYFTIIIMRLTRDFARKNAVSWADVSTADIYAAITFVFLTAISMYVAARADYDNEASWLIACVFTALLALTIGRFLPRWRAWHAGIRPAYRRNKGVGILQGMLAGRLARVVSIYDTSVMLVAFSTYIGLMFAFPHASQWLPPVMLFGVLAIPFAIASVSGRVPKEVPWVKVQDSQGDGDSHG